MKVKHISMKALQDDGTMLCDEVLSKKSYDMKKKTLGEDIASANYQQEPIDVKGRLYSSFKTYDDIPRDKNNNALFTKDIKEEADINKIISKIESYMENELVNSAEGVYS